MAHYSRISLAQLDQRMIERCGDNQIFWTTNERKNAINEAIRLWGILTGQWSRKFQILTVAGQVFYDMPKQIVSIQRAKYDSTVLFQTSLAELDYGYSNWQQASTSSPILWAPIGQDKIAIYPPAPVGHFLNLEGIALSPAVGPPGDFIDIGDEEINRLLDYAHGAYLNFKMGGKEFASGQELASGFMAACVERNQRLLASALFKRYAGLDKDLEQRPMRSVEKVVGARG